jgi:hypothetical protein
MLDSLAESMEQLTVSNVENGGERVRTIPLTPGGLADGLFAASGLQGSARVES